MIKTLELNFDPEEELEKHTKETVAIQQAEIVPSLSQSDSELQSLDLFEELQPNLKDKWLDYYEANRFWLKPFIDEKGSGYKYVPSTQSGRPSSEIILGVITTLEPRLAELLLYWFLVDADFDKVINTLGLHFDPEIELKVRAKEAAKTQQAEIIPSLAESSSEFASLDDIRQQIKQ